MADYADGWLPIGAVHGDDLREHVEDLKRRLEEAGRSPDAVSLSGFDPEPASADALLRVRELGLFERAIAAIA